MARKRIDSLTGARFLAIMTIVISHFEFLSKCSFGRLYDTYFHNPTMGVDFFFMLSGFGMMLSTCEICSENGGEKQSELNISVSYAIKHIKNIYPLYVTMLLIGIPYYLIYKIFETGASIISSVINSVIQLGCAITLLQSATGISSFSHALNGVCWFLSTLFCIYLISPMIMNCFKRVLYTKWLAMLGLGISIMISYILAILFDYIEKNTIFDDLVYGSPYRRVFYVTSGMIIAIIYRFSDKEKTSVALEYVSVAVSIIYFFVRNSVENKFGMLIYIIDMLVCSAFLYSLSLEKGRISKLLASKMMVYLGNISVYIFITHYLIRMYVDFLVRYFNLQSDWTAIIEVILILSLTMLISVLIERGQRLKKI